MEGRDVVFFEVEPWEQEIFKRELEGFGKLTFYPHRLTHDNVEQAKSANYIVSFIYSDLSARILDQLTQLKGIATMSVGIDHIDQTEAKRRNIVISNVPAYGPNTVAEHTIALLMALSRRIVPSVERTRVGDYNYTGLTGWDLLGKTLGIVGTGKIGAVVAKIAFGLGMKLVAYDPFPNASLTEQYGVEYLPLDTLLSRSDVVTLHIPSTVENKHLLGPAEFAKMKKGAVLLNTARGAIIDVQALVEALESGRVAQAGLDVLEDENLLKEERQFFSPYFNLSDYQTTLANHKLMHDERVLVTPHNAFNSREALQNIIQTTVANIRGMIERDPVNLVEK